MSGPAPQKAWGAGQDDCCVRTQDRTDNRSGLRLSDRKALSAIQRPLLLSVRPEPDTAMILPGTPYLLGSGPGHDDAFRKAKRIVGRRMCGEKEKEKE